MAGEQSEDVGTTRRSLERVDNVAQHTFKRPSKEINDGPDVSFFLTSYAYRDIMTFVLQLNHAMVPRKSEPGVVHVYEMLSPESDLAEYSRPVQKLREVIEKLESLIEEAPPDTGPRRFGNVSFRKWYKLAESRIPALLNDFLPEHVPRQGPFEDRPWGLNDSVSELEEYFTGSFGDEQRLDYGTGHELSFIAFLGCLWKLSCFADGEPGEEERGIVLGVFQPYLQLIRKLIMTYTLEPAGSHGVWGLDDNSFLPYVFGSAQFCPAISESDKTPVEGSMPDAPKASSVTDAKIVTEERKRNMYFSAVGNIYDMKKGPFWEHSPMLFDISGITAGWGKINKGMLKMYNAEVLSKFPVVQHFPFGSLFRWEKDPNALPPPPTSHQAAQPLRSPHDMNQPVGIRNAPAVGTAAPWAKSAVPGDSGLGPGTAAPWGRQPAQPPMGMVDGVTRAPWASTTPAAPPRGLPGRGAVPAPRVGVKPVVSTAPTTLSSTKQDALGTSQP